MKFWFRILLNAVLACAALTGARAAALLDITAVSASPGSVTPGQAVRFTITVTNNAAAPTSGVLTRNDFPGGDVDLTLRLTSLTAAPINLGVSSVSIPALAAGGSTDVIVSQTIPSGYSQAGSYFVVAMLDYAPTTRATATAVLSAGVDRIAVTNAGSGYTSAPTVTVAAPGGGGTTATAVAVVASGAIVAVQVTNPGSGYTSAPAVSIAAPGGTGAPASASASISGGVSSVTINNAGVGSYQVVPRVVFTGGGGGNGASASATVAATAVNSIAVSSAGSGYTTAPIVTIAGGAQGPDNGFGPATLAAGSFTTATPILSVLGNPDFDITSLSYPAGVSYRGGDIIPMTLTFVNHATSNNTANAPFIPGRQSNYFRVQVVLSSNPVYGDADDMLLTFHNVAIPIMADDVPHVISWNQLLPGNFPGSYYVLAKIDSLNQVTETIEEDLTDPGNNIWLDVNATRIAILPSTFPTIYLASNTGTLTPASVTSGNGYSDNPSITSDGRYLAFASDASNLVAGDTNSARDIFLFDSQVGSVRRLNLSQQGAQGNANSHTPAVSGNGRYLAFSSDATNLVFGDNNGFTDIFVVDTITGAISRLSLASDGTQANNSSFKPAISTTGRYVVFESSATNLVSPATAVGVTHIYLRDRDVSGSGVFDTAGNVSTTLISASTAGTRGDRNSIQAAISGDGQFVAFASDATNLIAGDTNGYRDVFVRAVATSTTTRVSVGPAGVQSLGGATGGDSRAPSISSDGRYVAFSSDAFNLVAGDSNNISDVFVHDRNTSTTTRVSVSDSGGQASDPFSAPFQLGSFNPNISSSGRYVAFASLTNNLSPGDAAGQANVLAAATVAGGAVTGIAVTNPGGGLQHSNNRAVSYLTVPNVTITGGGGTGAAAVAILSGGNSGNITGFTITNPGSGYTSAPTVRVVQSFNQALNIYVFDRDLSGDGVFDTAGDISTSLVSVNRFGYQAISVLGNQSSPAADIYPVISGDGRWVGLPADSETSPGLSHTTTNLISNDNNSARDVFLHDRRLNTLPNPTNPPVVNITSPGAGSSALVNTAINVTASATTSIGVVSRVQFFVDGTSIGTSTIFPYAATWTPTAVGTYTLSAIVTDSFGNTGISPNISVTINAAPSIGITAPTPNATITAGTAQTITAVAAASNPGATITSVQFLVNGSAIGTANAAPYTTAWTPAAAGTYTLTAIATDSVGTQTTSIPVVITVSPPGGTGTVTPPSVSIAAPASGTSIVVNTPTVVTATATAAGGTVTSVEFFANGISIGSSATYPYRVTWTPVTLGTFALTATATDQNGTQATSAAANITVSAGTAPLVALVTPSNGLVMSAGSTQTITATASSSVGNIVSVAFYANNVLLGTDLAFPYAQSWTPAGPGFYTLKAVATDSSGMEGTSSVVQVNVTGNLPALPTVSVTNPVNGALITVNTPQTIIANATSPATIQSVEFFANGAPLGVVTVFPYALSWTPTALGAYAITARATDSFGQQTTSNPVAVSVERGSATQPAVFVTSPTTGTSVVVNRSVFVSAQAVDLDGEVASVEFFANNQSIGVSATAPYFTAWVPTAVGNYNITAVVMDNAGNRVTSAITTLAVVAQAGLAPVVGLKFNDPSIDATATTTPPVTTPVPVAYNSKLLLNASAVDQDGSISRVQFFANGTSIATVSAAPFSTVWQLNTLADVVITALVTDNSGNSVYTNPILIDTVASNSATSAAVNLVSPLDGASYVTGSQIIFSATHNFGNVTPPKIDFYVNGSQFSTVATAPYQTLLGITRAGTYEIHAVGRSGNVTTVSAPVRITVNSNTAPSVSITSPVAGTSFVVGTGLTIAAAASDPDGTIQDVQFFVNGASLSTDANTPYTAAWNPGAAGTYRLTAMATDNAGNQTLSAVVVVTLTGNTPPTVSITTPSNGFLTNSGSAVALSAQAADADGTIASVRFLANGIVVGTATTAPFAATWTPTAAGTYTVIAQATDDSGNVTSSSPISVTVSANAAPVVGVTSPTNGAVVRTGTSVTLSATASDPDGTIASVRFLANGTVVGVPDTTAPYSVSWTPNAEGVFRITAIALDSSGVSTTSPAATVLVVPPGAGDTVYSGTFAGFGENGRFAAINLGGTSASFIGFSTPLPGSSATPTIYFHPSLPVDAIGGFTRTDGSGRALINGTASDTGVSGTLDAGRLIFIGPVTLAATAAVPPGYYTGNLGGRMGSTLAAIVGADGAMTAYIADGAYRDAGSGTVNRNGAFVVTLISGNRFTGTIDPLTGFVTGNVSGTVVAGATAALSSGVSFSDGFLRNLSTRGQVGTGANLLIAGFVVGGNTPKQVLIRAIGPSLAAFGVSGVLLDPQLEIYSGSALTATNNNWGGGLPIIDASNRVGAFPLPQNSLDAVLLLTLAPGSYTAQVRGVGNGTGVALIELYDVDSLAPFSPQKVMNVSSRGVVGTGQAQLIAGFVVSGNTSKKILVRAVGPSLSTFGVEGVLADPVLSITRTDGLAVRENDNWETGNDPMLIGAAAERVRTFALPGGSRDAALLIQLPPGSYTAQVTGAGNSTGVALVEVYEVP